jgi:PKD repeat protein
MKRAFLLLLPAVLLVFFATTGCNDESTPRVARITVYPACGVAPLQVDCRTEVTGGNEAGDPTGGNNNLEIAWNFDDGGTSNTSIAYHTFASEGEYQVRVTATDPDGKTATAFQMVTVYADTLKVQASDNVGGVATVNDTVYFGLRAESCFIDPDNDGDYRNLTFSWAMNDTSGAVYSSRNPRHSFSYARLCTVTVAATFPALSVTRRDTLIIDVVEP